MGVNGIYGWMFWVWSCWWSSMLPVSRNKMGRSASLSAFRVVTPVYVWFGLMPVIRFNGCWTGYKRLVLGCWQSSNVPPVAKASSYYPGVGWSNELLAG